MNKFLEALGLFINKLSSGRFLVTVLMAFTYCKLAEFMVTKLADKISGDFVLGFLGGFSTSFMLMMQWYFDKEQDKPQNDGGQ